MNRYIGAIYSDSCQPAIMTETPATFPDPYMPIIIPDTCVEIPETNAEILYLENNGIDEAIHQKLRKKDEYETNVHNIYNIIIKYYGSDKRKTE